MAEINLVGNLFANHVKSEKSEGALEGVAGSQSMRPEIVGGSFSPILAQFISALLSGGQQQETQPTQIQQESNLIPCQTEVVETQAAEAPLGEQLAKVAQNGLGSALSAIAAAQTSMAGSVGEAQRPEAERPEAESDTPSASPKNVISLMKAAVGNRATSTKNSVLLTLQDDATNEAVADLASTEKEVHGSSSLKCPVTAGKVSMIPVDGSKSPTSKKQTGEKNASTQDVPVSQSHEGDKPEAEEALLAAVPESVNGDLAAGLQVAMMVTEQELNLSKNLVQMQHGVSSSEDLPNTSQALSQNASEPLSSVVPEVEVTTNPVPSALIVDASVMSSEKPVEGVRNQQVRAKIEIASEPGVVYPAGPNNYATDVASVFQKEVATKGDRDSENEDPLHTGVTVSKPMGKRDFENAGPVRTSTTISRLFNLPVDKVVMVKNQVGNGPVATAVASSPARMDANSIMGGLPAPDKPNEGKSAPTLTSGPDLTKDGSTTRVTGVTPRAASVRGALPEEGNSDTQVSSASVASTKGDAARVGTDRESRADSNPKGHDWNQSGSTTRDVVRADEGSKSFIDPIGSAITSTPNSRESAEAVKHLAATITPKVDLRQDTQSIVHAKPMALPPELLSSVHDQIAREVLLKVANNVSEIRVMLKPESLGDVTVHVRMEEGSMVARIDVNQPNVRAALEANLPQLRETLVGKGVQVDRIDVMTSSFSSSRESSNQQRDRSRTGLKRNEDVEAVESYEAGRFLGYNTMDYLI